MAWSLAPRAGRRVVLSILLLSICIVPGVLADGGVGGGTCPGHAASGDDYEFVTTWGSKGTGDGEFDHPYGIAVDGSGYVYVADTYNNRIQTFTTDGTFVTTWGSYGSGDGEFQGPYGIAVDGSGYVYVADTDNHRIQTFTTDGTFVTKWGSEGSGDGEFGYPDGIAVDGSGYVYVADSYNNHIQAFTTDGTFVTKWGSEGSGDGEFHHPEGIAVDGSGYVYVADANNNRIQTFTTDGTFVTKWGSYGSGDGEFYYPADMAVDGSGYVYVADTNNNRIQVFRPAGGGGSTLDHITVSPSSAALSVGETQQFTATGYDSGGTVITITPTWTSSNTTVGSISQSGLFTAIAAGTTTVTAESEGVSGTAAVTVTAEPVVSGSVTRSISPSSPSPGDTVTVTLTPSSTMPVSPGWGVTETLDASLVYVTGSSTADSVDQVGDNQYQFTRLGGSAFTYQVTAPATEGTYTITGTWTDGEKTTGTVGGDTAITVSDLISRYTDPSTGKVEKDGAVQAVNDYLFSGIISKEDAITVVNAYLFG